jgi:hypothetical protein
MTQPLKIDFDTMKPDEFEQYLPELFATGNGKVSSDPRLKDFLTRYPDCAALVSDLETIAETARSLFDPVEENPSDSVWANIKSKLKDEDGVIDEEFEPDFELDGVKEID